MFINELANSSLVTYLWKKKFWVHTGHIEGDVWLELFLFVPVNLCSELHAFSSKKYAIPWDFPMVHLLRIHLPMQEAWVQFLVREDLRCCGATKPLLHSCWARKLQEEPLHWEGPAPKLRAAQADSPHYRKPTCSNDGMAEQKKKKLKVL